MENLKNQERQPANAATPEKAEEKGQTPKQGKKEAKPLTPEEMLKRKKMLVYPLFFLVFLGAMWLIFAPSDSDEPLREGFNVAKELFSSIPALWTPLIVDTSASLIPSTYAGT